MFIDGEAAPQKQIRQRLEATKIESSDRRRWTSGAREALNAADAVILCLPDEAAKEAVAMIDNPAVRVIDASTAYRVDPAWTYGFAEMDVISARPSPRRRVSNPAASGGCRLAVRW